MSDPKIDKSESDTEDTNPLSQALAGIKKTAKRAPFASRTRLRYRGSKRMFVGYEAIPLLEPGTQLEVSDTSGQYSICVVDVLGVKYELVISSASSGDWTEVSKPTST